MSDKLHTGFTLFLFFGAVIAWSTALLMLIFSIGVVNKFLTMLFDPIIIELF